MKKKILLSVFVFAVVALAVFASYKTLNANAAVADLMLDENIEALTRGEDDQAPNRENCYAEGGLWNMASVCADGKVEVVTCTKSGEITIFGITLKGSYTKGKPYAIAWARYTCITSTGNCCKMQGIYSGGTKVA